MKKKILIIILIFACFTLCVRRVNALNITEISNNINTLAVECTIFPEGSQFKPWLESIYSFIKFLAPSLAIVFTIIEFFKAILSDKKEALQTAAKRTGIRIILCLLIFFIPLIVNFIFGTILHMCGTQGIN